MNIRLIMLGKNKGRYIESGISDFVKKLRPFCQLELIYLKDERVHKDVNKILEKEADRVLKLIQPGEFLIVLDENGKSFSSESLSKYFSRLKDKGISNVYLVIGSSHGLALRIKESADLLLSLSGLTMNHQIVRLVLLEQIYRIFTIQRGIPYHK